MKAGDLRHRVTIQRQADPQTRDAFGAVTTAWSTLATVWAAVEPQAGSETVENDRRIATVVHNVRIRRRTDVTPAMRVLHEARVFEVLAILDSNKPGQTVLQCREVV